MQETHTLLEVDNDGVILKMIDGSEWEVSIGDNTKSILWLPTARLNIVESEDVCIITNLDTTGPDSVRARRRL